MSSQALVEASPATSVDQLTDTLTWVETPEGVRLQWAPAGLVARGLAFAIDSVLQGLAQGVVLAVFSVAGEIGIGLMLVFMFLLLWFYPVAFEMLNRGQTPGKQVLGIRVVHDDGTPIRLQASMVRNLLLVVDYLPGVPLIGPLCMVLDQRFRRLGDLVAGTMVVHHESKVRHPITVGVKAIPLPMALPIWSQRLLVAFAERLPNFSSERANELAAILEPLTQQRGAESVNTLVGYARTILGENKSGEAKPSEGKAAVDATTPVPMPTPTQAPRQ